MIFVDTNVFMYAVGVTHAFQTPPSTSSSKPIGEVRHCALQQRFCRNWPTCTCPLEGCRRSMRRWC